MGAELNAAAAKTVLAGCALCYATVVVVTIFLAIAMSIVNEIGRRLRTPPKRDVGRGSRSRRQ